MFLQDLRRELEEKEKNVGRERRSRESGWNTQKKPRLEGGSVPNVQDEDDPYDDDISDVCLSFFAVFTDRLLYDINQPYLTIY